MAQIMALCGNTPDPGAKVSGSEGLAMRKVFDDGRERWIDEQVRNYG
jgi:hypothetical protein